MRGERKGGVCILSNQAEPHMNTPAQQETGCQIKAEKKGYRTRHEQLETFRKHRQQTEHRQSPQSPKSVKTGRVDLMRVGFEGSNVKE